MLNRLSPQLFNIDYWVFRSVLRSLQDFLAKHGERCRGGTAVDFGSWESPYKQLFADLDIKLLAADIGNVRPGMLKIGDDGRLPLEDESIEMLLSTQVLEHVPNMMGYLHEALRVLKPGGVMYLSTHGTWHLHRHPTDMRRWTIDGLRYDIDQSGFQVESVTPYVGRMATCTYQRTAALSDLMRPYKILNPIRATTNLIGNLRMCIEEMCTTQTGLEKLQQLLVAIAVKPQAPSRP